jgi:DNA-binding protein H-NS
MEKLDLEAMPLDDLWALHKKLSRFLSERMTAEKQQLEERLERLNRVDEAYGSAELKPIGVQRENRRRKYPRVLPKFQNPQAPFETWAGRGRQPRWLILALKEGGKIEDFEIPAMERASSRSRPNGPNRRS